MSGVGIYQVCTGEIYLIKTGHQTRRLKTSFGSNSAEPNGIQRAQTFEGKNY